MNKKSKANFDSHRAEQLKDPVLAERFKRAGEARSGKVMNREMKHLRALAAEVVALQAKARALGLFANDRELLECPKCGLQEDVAFSGLLLTSYADSIGEDTGLRFEDLARDRFRCPACGAIVREPVSTAPVLEKKGGTRSCRSGRKPRS